MCAHLPSGMSPVGGRRRGGPSGGPNGGRESRGGLSDERLQGLRVRVQARMESRVGRDGRNVGGAGLYVNDRLVRSLIFRGGLESADATFANLTHTLSLAFFCFGRPLSMMVPPPVCIFDFSFTFVSYFVYTQALHPSASLSLAAVLFTHL